MWPAWVVDKSGIVPFVVWLTVYVYLKSRFCYCVMLASDLSVITDDTYVNLVCTLGKSVTKYYLFNLCWRDLKIIFHCKF